VSLLGSLLSHPNRHMQSFEKKRKGKKQNKKQNNNYKTNQNRKSVYLLPVTVVKVKKWKNKTKISLLRKMI